MLVQASVIGIMALLLLLWLSLRIRQIYQAVTIKHLIVAVELQIVLDVLFKDYYQMHLNKSRASNSINKVHGERSQLDNIVGAIKDNIKFICIGFNSVRVE